MPLGHPDGDSAGISVGRLDGIVVGKSEDKKAEGDLVGVEDGCSDFAAVETAVGEELGCPDGIRVGKIEGIALGFLVEIDVGVAVGCSDFAAVETAVGEVLGCPGGIRVGKIDGIPLGFLVEIDVGVAVGSYEADGLLEGISVGNIEGRCKDSRLNTALQIRQLREFTGSPTDITATVSGSCSVSSVKHLPSCKSKLTPVRVRSKGRMAVIQILDVVNIEPNMAGITS